ncbi:MAG: hypothetical protein JWN57_503 [Frankiales bacterium]|jgi:hypothetical protein|nr:hypothetical protein [Frankiales bacterium]
MTLEAALIAAVSLLVLMPVTLIARRRVLQRRYGTIDLSLRLRRGTRGRGWVLGIGRFEGDDLQWYRVFSLAPRPRRTLSRRDLEVRARREPRGPESLALLKGAVVMECRSGSGPVELAMEGGAVTGFLAWLEARPPGATLPG